MCPPAVHVNVASGFAQPPPALQASGFAQPPQPPPASQASGIDQPSAAVPMKGYGKGANLGIPLPLPMPASSPQSASVHVGSLPQVVPLTLPTWGDETPLPMGCPPPFKPDEAYCKKWFDDEFTVLATPERWPPAVGDQVLWKSVRNKASGYESGKQEYFNGLVHAIEECPTHGTFLIVC